MPQTVRVQVLFWEETAKGRYQDALYYTLEEYDKLTQAIIDAEKQKRLDKWLLIVSAPPIEVTKEMLEQDIAITQEEITRMQNDIARFQSKIAEIESE